jgi:hypothetical protein
MLFVDRVPRLLRWIVSVVIIFLAVMTAMRFAFFMRYALPGKPLSGSAMLMGFRFDLKFICMLAVFMLVVCAIPFANPFKHPRAHRFWYLLLTLVFIVMMFSYAVDFFYYGYLEQRLNANILSYLVDTKISTDVVWEAYPIVRVILAITLLTAIATVGFRLNVLSYKTKQPAGKRSGVLYYILFFLLFALGIFGKLGQFNLRWSDAFTLNDSFKANLAPQPLSKFFQHA